MIKGGVEQSALAWAPASGVFQFGDDQLIEIPVKMQKVGNFYWFYYGSMTNESYTVRVTDTSNNAVREYNGHGPWCGAYDLNSF